MSSEHSKRRLGLMLALSLFLWQPAVAGVPLGVGGDGQNVPTLAPLLEQVTPGVVNIAVRGHVAAHPNPLLDDPFFRRFFGAPEQQQPQRLMSPSSKSRRKISRPCRSATPTNSRSATL